MKFNFFEKGKALMLAPMAELTTPPLRRVVRDFSPKTILFSEMLSSPAVVTGALYNEPLMAVNEGDEPIIFQLLGGDPESMATACSILYERGCSGININMGCSSPTILRQCRGARLLKEVDLARKVVAKCRNAFDGSLSVKLRTGFDRHDGDFLLEFCSMLQDEGVDFIIVHGRFAKLAFKRRADWSYVKILKDNLSIPVVGNGDVESPGEILERFDETGCDGIMVGREAVKSPWIFAAGEALLGGENSYINIDLLDVGISILSGLEESLPPEFHKSRAHRFCFYYSKNFIFSHELFRKIRNVDKIPAMINILTDYLEINSHERFKTFQGG